jgi:hypothetical protein
MLNNQNKYKNGVITLQNLKIKIKPLKQKFIKKGKWIEKKTCTA